MHDSPIIPAVIPRSLEHLRESLRSLRGVAPSFQIDLVDGKYAGEPSWPYVDDGAVLDAVFADTQEVSVEFDLMVREPRAIIPLIGMNAERIVLHLHDHVGLSETLSLIPEGVTAGIALRNDDPVDAILGYATQIKFIQCMGIRTIGVQGQPFDDRVLSRIRELRVLYPELEISVDGGVSVYTLPLLKDAGATRFVAGSAIFAAPDPVRAYEELVRIAAA